MPTPSSVEFGAWIVCLAAAVWGANQVMKFFRGFREEPRPAETYATKAELQELKVEIREQLEHVGLSIDALRRDREADKQEILRADEERSTAIHNRVNDVLTAVSRLQGKLDK